MASLKITRSNVVLVSSFEPKLNVERSPIKLLSIQDQDKRKLSLVMATKLLIVISLVLALEATAFSGRLFKKMRLPGYYWPTNVCKYVCMLFSIKV